MTNNKLIHSYRKLILGALGLILAIMSTNPVFAKTVKIKTNQKGIIGVWQLKRTIIEKGAKNLNVFMPVKETPESLILAFEEGTDEITINEGFKEFIQTQTFPTDGKIINSSIQQIGKVSTTAKWQDGKLVVEMMTESGDKMIETFELSNKQNLLNVSLQIIEAKTARTTKIRRIYQKVAEVEDENTAQVGITVYPF